MNRRGFLGTLVASAAGLLIPRDALWLPSGLDAPALQVGAITGLDAMTRQVALYLSELVGGSIVQGSALGMSALNQQMSVEFRRDVHDIDHFGLDPERYLRPCAGALAAKCQQLKVDRFGTLEIPEFVAHGATITGHGVSVRGLADYVMDGEFGLIPMVRFDVIGIAA